MNAHVRFMLGSVAFLIVLGGSLFLLLAFIWRYYPAPVDPMAMMGPNGQPRSLWQMLSEWRLQPPAAERQQARRNLRGRPKMRTAPSEGGAESGAPPVDTMANDHLALREAAEAEQIRLTQFRSDLPAASRRLQAIPADIEISKFEILRFQNRLLLTRFAEDSDHAVVPELYKVAVATAESPMAQFEDYYVAAVACLFHGRPLEAQTWILKAESTWPSRGRGYGDVFMLHIMVNCVLGNDPQLIAQLSEFKTTYPDWLYIETFVQDIDDLGEVYPDKPLLHVLRGRVHYFVNDFASADTEWQKALASPTLSGTTRHQVKVWLAEIEKARTP